MKKPLLKIPVVLLAAGKSSRMRPHKALYPFKGKAWIIHQVESLLQKGFESVSVVLGYQKDDIKKVISNLQVNLFENPNPELGQFSSLMCVLNYCSQDIFVLPLDTPCPEKSVWEALAERKDKEKVMRPKFEDRVGHPVLISGEFIKTLKGLEISNSESRLDFQIKKLNPHEISDVDVLDHKILLNLNTLPDFEALSLAKNKAPAII